MIDQQSRCTPIASWPRPSFRVFIVFIIVGIAPCFLVGISPALAEKMSGFTIMEKVYSKKQGDTISSTIEMVLTGTDGKQRKRRMEAFTKRYSYVTKRVFFFLSPKDVKGTALLTFDYPSRDKQDEQWIYLPALHKTKRISSGNRSGSLMGSDFSYGDMTQKSIESYTYNLLREQEKDTHREWIIEALPRDETTVNEYGYSKSLYVIRQDNFVITRAVHWLAKSKKLKYFEVVKLQQFGEIWVPVEVLAKTVRNGKTLHQTRLISTKTHLNQPINDDLFTKRRLEHGF